MYGVTDSFDLSLFVGTTLEQIALGSHQIVFRFDPQGSIASEGRWVLLDRNGEIVDESTEPAGRDAYRVHKCLGLRVVGANVEPPTAITLTFEDGFVLRFLDDSKQYESFHIEPGGVHV
jgi:hypothetical protein